MARAIGIETPTSAFYEGQTLPVRIQGGNFFTSYTRVRIADAALRPYFAVGPVFVAPNGDELGTVLDAASGLTRYEAEAAFSLSLVREGASLRIVSSGFKAETEPKIPANGFPNFAANVAAANRSR